MNGQVLWVEITNGGDFSLRNIPFGVISYDRATSPRPAIGDYALDLRIFASAKGFDEFPNTLKVIACFDGDQVVIRGWCRDAEERVGFGTCTGVVLDPWPRDVEQELFR